MSVFKDFPGLENSKKIQDFQGTYLYESPSRL